MTSPQLASAFEAVILPSFILPSPLVLGGLGGSSKEEVRRPGNLHGESDRGERHAPECPGCPQAGATEGERRQAIGGRGSRWGVGERCPVFA